MGRRTLTEPTNSIPSSGEWLTPPARHRIAYHPDFAGAAYYTIEARPGDGTDDEANTAQTTGRMAQYIREDSRNPIVRNLAYRISTGPDPRIDVHAWMRRNVKFVPDAQFAEGISADPDGAEVLVRPVDLLTMPEPEGDCDCQTMTAAALLRALGVTSWLKTVECDDEQPGRYSHIYLVSDGPGGPMPLDVSHGPYPGWEVAATGKSRLWPIEQGKTNMSRLGDLFSDLFTVNGDGTVGPNIQPGDYSPGSSSGGFDWTSLVNTGINDATSILGVRYGVPQTAPGQSIRLPNGTIATTLPAGTTAAVSSGLSSGMLLLVAGLIVGAVVLSNKRS